MLKSLSLFIQYYPIVPVKIIHIIVITITSTVPMAMFVGPVM